MSDVKHTPEPWKDDRYVSRFWSRVNVLSNEECWEWQRGKTRDGYGVFHFGRKSIRTHRFSYQLHNGDIKEHDCVCHSCDNPCCVNPHHLWVGTRADNNADKEAKGRAVHVEQKNGELNSNATLSSAEVISVKVMVRLGLPQARIAKFLGVSNATVCMIVNGKRWGDLTEDRVSAAINACAAISTERLEMALPGQMKSSLDRLCAEIDELTSQRDQLLEALECLFASYKQIADSGDAGNWSLEDYDEGKKALAAIAAVKGVPPACQEIVSKKWTGEWRWFTPDETLAPAVLQRKYFCTLSDGTSGNLWLDAECGEK